MLKLIIAAFFVTLSLAAACRADKSAVATQYLALVEEFEQEGGARAFAKRFLVLAEEHPKDPVAVDALLWVVKKVRGRTDTDNALKLLTGHIHSKKLGPACSDIAQSRSARAETLLRRLLEKSPHESTRAHAGYYLAVLLDLEANIVDQLKAQPDLGPRVLQYYGKQYGKHLSSLDSAKLEKAREDVYERLLKSFPNVEIQDAKIKEVARQTLFRIRNLSVGKIAPEIEGEDIAGEAFKLSDYRGKVVMLTFWGHW